MRRAIGKLCRWTGARLVCVGLRLNAIGHYLAPRKRVVVVVPWVEPAAWTQAHEGPRQNAPAIGGRN